MKDIFTNLATQWIPEAFSYIKKRWYRKETLVLVVVVCFLLFLFWDPTPLLLSINLTKVLTAIGACVLAGLFWYFTARLPKTPNKKVGFGVAILAETKEQNEKILSDFIITLQKLLLNKDLKYKFHFINYPSHFTEQLVDRDDAVKLLKSSRLHFLIYGRVRTRSINGVDNHFLELDGIVSHAALHPDIQAQFSKEFGDLFPRNITMPSENDMLAFKFTADIIDYVASYIIGIAAALSGDAGYAQSIFEDLDKRLGKIKSDLPAIIKLKERLPSRLCDVHYIQAWQHFNSWKGSKDKRVLLNAKPHLDYLKVADPSHYNTRLLRASWIFVMTRDTKEALKEIRKCQNIQDITWKYDLAFLLAYDGKLDSALKEYRRAFKGTIAPIALQEILDFIPWILKIEPDKIQLHFCLGLTGLTQKLAKVT